MQSPKGAADGGGPHADGPVGGEQLSQPPEPRDQKVESGGLKVEDGGERRRIGFASAFLRVPLR